MADPTHYRITVNVGVNEDDPHQIDYVRSLADAIAVEVSNHGWPADAVSSERLSEGAENGSRCPRCEGFGHGINATDGTFIPEASPGASEPCTRCGGTGLDNGSDRA